MRIVLLLALGAAKLSAAGAPDSVTGKVYHEFSVLIRAVSDFTIRFDADGQYHFLKNVGGSTVTGDGSLILLDTPADGTYTYTRIDAANATITLSEPGGTLALVSRFRSFGSSTSAVLTLTFDTEARGNPNGGTTGTFFFSDVGALQTSPVVNLAMRAVVTPAKALIVGFTIPGNPNKFSESREALIRVVGPGLTSLGVDGAWADPDFQLFRGAFRTNVGAHFGDQSHTPGSAAALQKIYAETGAFPLATDSKDAAAIVRLYPGAYTIIANTAAGDAGGEALVEVYFLP